MLASEVEHFGHDVAMALRAGGLPADARPALEALIATLAEILGESASLELSELPRPAATLF
jgi:hypothetical protein